MLIIRPTFQAYLCGSSVPMESGVISELPVTTQGLALSGVMSGPLLHCISESLVRGLL